jgi:ABC-2 type transport system ATP-binding protein
VLLGKEGSEITYVYGSGAGQDGVPALLDAVRGAGLRVKDLETSQSSLEDIFVDLVRDEA